MQFRTIYGMLQSGSALSTMYVHGTDLFMSDREKTLMAKQFIFNGIGDKHD